MTARYRDYPVTPMLRVYYCDCGAELIRGGLSRPLFPPTYQHTCSMCQQEYWLTSITRTSIFPADHPMAIEPKERQL